MRGAPRVIKNRTAWDQKNNSQTMTKKTSSLDHRRLDDRQSLGAHGMSSKKKTMTKKTKRSDDASSDSTDDADFFSSAVRHSGWQSCSQITVRTVLSSSCDASEPSYTKQSFMTNRPGPLQHPSSSKQKKQHTHVMSLFHLGVRWYAHLMCSGLWCCGVFGVLSCTVLLWLRWSAAAVKNSLPCSCVQH